MRRPLALAALATGLAVAGSAAACERHDPCRRPPPPSCRCEPPPRVVYEHRYIEREVYRPRVQEVSLSSDFFYGGGGVEAPVGGADVYYGGYVIAAGGASASASAFASARTSVSVGARFRSGYHHGGSGQHWGGGRRGGGR